MPIRSFDANALKSSGRICANCNNTRTQPHDRAWEQMSRWFGTRNPPIAPGTIVRANRIFPYDTVRKMLSVHLYFVKLFGCLILEANLSVDLRVFGSAILRGKASPNLYLKFGRFSSEANKIVAGRSNMEAEFIEGSPVFASWFYDVGNIAINVIFAERGEERQGLLGAWHPRCGTNRLVIADFR